MRPKSINILELFRDGSPDDWEGFAGLNDSFPEGVDSLGAPWILEAISCGSPNCVRWMIERGAPLNFRTNTGDTVFHACIERKNSDAKYEILLDLIKSGADINQTGYNGWAPLHLAAVRNDQRSVELLLNHGADKHLLTTIDDCATAEEEALSAGNIEIARIIREHAQ